MANQLRAQVVASSPAQKRQASEPVDLKRIFQMESNYVADAHNKATDARGLGQITPITLKDWNQQNPEDQHAPDELFMPQVNAKISNWYLNNRVPQMISAAGLPDSVDNRLIAYHDGVGNLKKTLGGQRTLGPEMQGYLKKYKTINVTGQPIQPSLGVSNP